jgi:uncharacterized protein (TIGR02757 family)
LSFDLKSHFDSKVARFNNPAFIAKDPISIPHQFSLKQDIEIIGFWTAMLSWGQRITIINKSKLLIELMGGKPYDFILNHSENDLMPFEEFKHRTFNGDDALYFIHFFHKYYSENDSLQTAFTSSRKSAKNQMEEMLAGFNNAFFDDEYALKRTRKHVASPARKSTCKRLNMFMRWMVRRDDKGVDFGLWQDIPMSALKIPLDVHVEKIARKYGLLTRKQRDWQAVLEITEHLIKFDKEDPVKYDYAMFGESLLEKDLDFNV